MLKNNVLNELFESKEENICVITQKDREKINELIKDNDSYENLIEFLENFVNDELAKDKIKDSLESYIDGINIVGAYENEKFYKKGFIDGVNLIIECIGNQ